MIAARTPAAGMKMQLALAPVALTASPTEAFDIIEEPVNYIVRKVEPGYFDKQPLTYPPAAPVVVSAVETTP